VLVNLTNRPPNPTTKENTVPSTTTTNYHYRPDDPLTDDAPADRPIGAVRFRGTEITPGGFTSIRLPGGLTLIVDDPDRFLADLTAAIAAARDA
jgi:hypothetical protein